MINILKGKTKEDIKETFDNRQFTEFYSGIFRKFYKSSPAVIGNGDAYWKSVLKKTDKFFGCESKVLFVNDHKDSFSFMVKLDEEKTYLCNFELWDGGVPEVDDGNLLRPLHINGVCINNLSAIELLRL